MHDNNHGTIKICKTILKLHEIEDKHFFPMQQISKRKGGTF